MEPTQRRPVIRVGVVGVGEVAQTTHLPTLQLLSHLYKVTALCDVSEQTLRHCAMKFGTGKTYTDYSDMLRDPEVDLVMILAADEYHTSMAVEAADAGKAVFVEKPMALTHADAKTIIDAESRNKTVIFVGYMRRYAPAFEVFKNIVHAIKKVEYVRVRDIIGLNKFFVDQSATFPSKFTDFTSSATSDQEIRAKTIASIALGDLAQDARNVAMWRMLGGLGSHDLSAMRELFGLPKSCFAASRSASGLSWNALFEYEGFTAMYESAIDEVAKFDAHIEVHGEGKRVKIVFDTPYVKGLPVLVSVLEADADSNFQERTLRPTYKDAYTIELEQLHECIVGGAPCKTSPRDAAQDLAIFDMFMGALKN